MAYSDELEFKKRRSQSFAFKKIQAITKKSQQPRTRLALEKKVVSTHCGILLF